MATAVKIQTLDTDYSILGTLTFERKEAAASAALPRVKSVEREAQNGQPTFILLQGNINPFRNISVQIRIHGDSTLSKLLTIRNHILNGKLVRLYPKMQDDTSLFYDCWVDPATIPEQSVFSGEDQGGEILNLVFKEATQENQVIMVDDVIVE